MAEREIPSTPTPEEAVATLQHLAEVFLQARARHRDQVTVAGEEVSAHRRAMVLVDGEGNLCGADSEAERLLGSPAAKIIGAPAVSLFGKLPVGTEVVRTRIHRPDGTDQAVWVMRSELIFKDQRCIGLAVDARGAPVLLQGVAFDITETKRAEELVRASLREKETLLMEIHHRVKNNLQVTSSLLKLQADRIADESAQRALREGQGRIRSMALVHELLYRSKDLANVNLGEYARDLTRQLLRSHGVDPSRVRVE